MMMCKFEHDGDCCNCGSPQYMCKCKPNICGSVVPITNADRIRQMTDKELAEFIDKCEAAGYNDSSIARDKNNQLMDMLDWLKQPAEEG